MNPQRVLCIGAGYFSQFHLEAWNRIPEIEVVGLCDLNLERARRQAELFSIPHIFENAEKALDELRPDFVDVITRPEMHLTLVQTAASRGVPIICQKPLTPDFATAVSLVEAAERAGVPLMVHENFRFQPWYREIQRLLSEGVIGTQLHSLTFHSRPGDGWGADAYLARQPYFRDMPRLLVHETGVHFIDTFRFLAGEIEEVFAVLRRLNPVIQGEDTGLLTFRFVSGAVGVWDANRYNEGTAADPRLTLGQLLVEGDGGTLRLHDDARITIQQLGQPEREHPYRFDRQGFAGDCVYQTQRHFVDQLSAGKPFETNGREYLKTLAVQEAAYLSAAQNRPISTADLLPHQGDDVDQTRPAAQAARPSGVAGVGAPRNPGTRPRIIDLTQTLDNTLRGVTITSATRIAVEGWNVSKILLYSHCGTHMDAPRHFIEGASTIDRQALDVCHGPAKVINLAPVLPRELLTVARLSPWADRIRPFDRLLLRTDWYRRLGTGAYRNELPRISLELAHWLVEKQVALIGVEPPSVADVNSKEELTEIHQALFRGNVVIIEGLAHLDQIRCDDVEFIAFPLKVANGDGSPVRAIAIENTV